MVFKISLSENFSPPPLTLTTTTRSYLQLYDVSMLALLSPKTSRFVGLTMYRYRVRFQGPSKDIYITVFINNFFIVSLSKANISIIKAKLSKYFYITDLGPYKYYLGIEVIKN